MTTMSTFGTLMPVFGKDETPMFWHRWLVVYKTTTTTLIRQQLTTCLQVVSIMEPFLLITINWSALIALVNCFTILIYSQKNLRSWVITFFQIFFINICIECNASPCRSLATVPVQLLFSILVTVFDFPCDLAICQPALKEYALMNGKTRHSSLVTTISNLFFWKSLIFIFDTLYIPVTWSLIKSIF